MVGVGRVGGVTSYNSMCYRLQLYALRVYTATHSPVVSAVIKWPCWSC